MLHVTFDDRHDEWIAMRPERSRDDSGDWVPNISEKGCEVIISFVPQLLLYVKILRPDATYACQRVVQLKHTVTNMCLCGVPKAYKVEFGAAAPGVNQITSKLEVTNHGSGETYPNWVHVFDNDVEIIRCMDRNYLKEKITAPLTQAKRRGFRGAHEYLFPGYWRSERPNSTRKTGSGETPLGRPMCFHWEHMSEVD